MLPLRALRSAATPASLQPTRSALSRASDRYAARAMSSAASPAKELIPLKIDVTSDTICPFCVLGLRKLERALEQSPLTAPNSSTRIFKPEIRYLPYQLDPTLPVDKTVSKRDRYVRRFGEDRFVAMEQMMQKRGEDVGIKFSYGGPLRNTILSHRLNEKAYQVGGWDTQKRFLDLVFHHYFEAEGDPGDPEALAQFAHEAGVFASKSEADAFCASNELAREVEQGFQQARVKGITGVPNFEIVAQNPADADAVPVGAEIPGAQESETIVAFIAQIAKRVAPHANV